jgi:hypothetical protein
MNKIQKMMQRDSKMDFVKLFLSWVAGKSLRAIIEELLSRLNSIASWDSRQEEI